MRLWSLFVAFLLAAAVPAADPVVVWSSTRSSLAEFGGTALVGITIPMPTAVPVVVTLSHSGSAQPGADYLLAETSLTIPVGATSASMPVVSLPDSLDELNETIVISGSVSGAVWASTDTIALTITDDDAPPTLALDAGAMILTEGAAPGTVDVVLSAPSGRAITVRVTPSGNLAAADFAPLVVDIPPGSTRGSLTIQPVADGRSELVESGELILSASGATVVDPRQVTVTVIDADSPAITLTSTPTLLSESGGSATVIVTLTRAVDQDVAIPLVVSGSARLGSDVMLTAPAITIPAGATTGTTTLIALPDALAEGDERVVLTATAPLGLIVGSPVQATLIITEGPVDPVVSIAWVAPTHTESAQQPPELLVSLTAPALGPVTVTFVPGTSTATMGVDVTVPPGQVTLPTGTTALRIPVPVIDDRLDEVDEVVRVTATRAIGAALAPVRTTALKILDDDGPTATVAFDRASAGEGSVITATLTIAASSPQEVRARLHPILAAGAATWSPSVLDLRIPTGSLAASASLTVNDDRTYEPIAEMATVFDSLTGATLVGDLPRLSITSDDPKPQVSLSILPGQIPENSGTATVTLTADRPCSLPYTVTLIQSGSASLADVRVRTLTASFPANAVVRTIGIAARDDAVAEGQETVMLTLAPPAADAPWNPGAVHQSSLDLQDDERLPTPITWPAVPPVLIAGDPLTVAGLGLLAPIPGQWTLEPPAGTVLTTPVSRVIATFTPTDPQGIYLPATSPITVVVQDPAPVFTQHPQVVDGPWAGAVLTWAAAATDRGLQGPLTWSWSATGPGNVTWAASSATSTAIFPVPGIYTVVAEVRDLVGNTTSTTTTLVVRQAEGFSASLQVVGATIQPDGTFLLDEVVPAQIQAALVDGEMRPVVPAPGTLSWSVTGPAALSSAGDLAPEGAQRGEVVRIEVAWKEHPVGNFLVQFGSRPTLSSLTISPDWARAPNYMPPSRWMNRVYPGFALPFQARGNGKSWEVQWEVSGGEITEDGIFTPPYDEVVVQLRATEPMTGVTSTLEVVVDVLLSLGETRWAPEGVPGPFVQIMQPFTGNSVNLQATVQGSSDPMMVDHGYGGEPLEEKTKYLFGEHMAQQFLLPVDHAGLWTWNLSFFGGEGAPRIERTFQADVTPGWHLRPRLHGRQPQGRIRISESHPHPFTALRCDRWGLVDETSSQPGLVAWSISGGSIPVPGGWRPATSGFQDVTATWTGPQETESAVVPVEVVPAPQIELQQVGIVAGYRAQFGVVPVVGNSPFPPVVYAQRQDGTGGHIASRASGNILVPVAGQGFVEAHQVELQFPGQGSYRIFAQETDEFGVQAHATYDIEIQDNRPPTITGLTATHLPGSPVIQIRAEVADDQDPTRLSWTWEWGRPQEVWSGDEMRITGELIGYQLGVPDYAAPGRSLSTTDAVFLSTGDFSVRVTARDADGGTATYEGVLTITDNGVLPLAWEDGHQQWSLDATQGIFPRVGYDLPEGLQPFPERVPDPEAGIYPVVFEVGTERLQVERHADLVQSGLDGLLVRLGEGPHLLRATTAWGRSITGTLWVDHEEPRLAQEPVFTIMDAPGCVVDLSLPITDDTPLTDGLWSVPNLTWRLTESGGLTYVAWTRAVSVSPQPVQLYGSGPWTVETSLGDRTSRVLVDAGATSPHVVDERHRSTWSFTIPAFLPRISINPQTELIAGQPGYIQVQTSGRALPAQSTWSITQEPAGLVTMVGTTITAQRAGEGTLTIAVPGFQPCSIPIKAMDPTLTVTWAMGQLQAAVIGTVWDLRIFLNGKPLSADEVLWWWDRPQALSRVGSTVTFHEAGPVTLRLTRPGVQPWQVSVVVQEPDVMMSSPPRLFQDVDNPLHVTLRDPARPSGILVPASSITWQIDPHDVVIHGATSGVISNLELPSQRAIEAVTLRATVEGRTSPPLTIPVNRPPVLSGVTVLAADSRQRWQQIVPQWADPEGDEIIVRVAPRGDTGWVIDEQGQFLVGGYGVGPQVFAITARDAHGAEATWSWTWDIPAVVGGWSHASTPVLLGSAAVDPVQATSFTWVDQFGAAITSSPTTTWTLVDGRGVVLDAAGLRSDGRVGLLRLAATTSGMVAEFELPFEGTAATTVMAEHIDARLSAIPVHVEVHEGVMVAAAQAPITVQIPILPGWQLAELTMTVNGAPMTVTVPSHGRWDVPGEWEQIPATAQATYTQGEMSITRVVTLPPMVRDQTPPELKVTLTLDGEPEEIIDPPHVGPDAHVILNGNRWGMNQAIRQRTGLPQATDAVLKLDVSDDRALKEIRVSGLGGDERHLRCTGNEDIKQVSLGQVPEGRSEVVITVVDLAGNLTRFPPIAVIAKRTKPQVTVGYLTDAWRSDGSIVAGVDGGVRTSPLRYLVASKDTSRLVYEGAELARAGMAADPYATDDGILESPWRLAQPLALHGTASRLLPLLIEDWYGNQASVKLLAHLEPMRTEGEIDVLAMPRLFERERTDYTKIYFSGEGFEKDPQLFSTGNHIRVRVTNITRGIASAFGTSTSAQAILPGALPGDPELVDIPISGDDHGVVFDSIGVFRSFRNWYERQPLDILKILQQGQSPVWLPWNTPRVPQVTLSRSVDGWHESDLRLFTNHASITTDKRVVSVPPSWRAEAEDEAGSVMARVNRPSTSCYRYVSTSSHVVSLRDYGNVAVYPRAQRFVDADSGLAYRIQGDDEVINTQHHYWPHQKQGAGGEMSVDGLIKIGYRSSESALTTTPGFYDYYEYLNSDGCYEWYETYGIETPPRDHLINSPIMEANFRSHRDTQGGMMRCQMGALHHWTQTPADPIQRARNFPVIEDGLFHRYWDVYDDCGNLTNYGEYMLEEQLHHGRYYRPLPRSIHPEHRATGYVIPVKYDAISTVKIINDVVSTGSVTLRIDGGFASGGVGHLQGSDLGRCIEFSHKTFYGEITEDMCKNKVMDPCETIQVLGTRVVAQGVNATQSQSLLVDCIIGDKIAGEMDVTVNVGLVGAHRMKEALKVFKPDVVPTVPKFAECLKKRSGKADEPVIIMNNGGDKSVSDCSLVGTEEGNKNIWSFTAKYDSPVFTGDTGTYAVVWDLGGGQVTAGAAGSGQGGGTPTVTVKYHAGQYKPTLKVYRTYNSQTTLVGTAAIHTINVYSQSVDGTAWTVTPVAEDDRYGSETKLERKTDEGVGINVRVGVDVKAQGTCRARISPDGYPQNEYWVTAGDSGDLPQPYAFKPESTTKGWTQGYGDPSAAIDDLSVRIKASKNYGDDTTDAKFTTVLVEAGVDASRDQHITFDETDRASVVNPYRFWLNNDHDARGDFTAGFSYIEEDDVEGPADSSGNTITCQRDLEDFTRYWVAISNRSVIGSRLRQGDVQMQFRLRPRSGLPQVKLFLAADPDGGLAYLTDYSGVGRTQAADPGNAGANMKYHNAATPSVGSSFVSLAVPGGGSLADALVTDAYAPDGNRTLAPFLFEGVSAGVGDLEVRLTVTLDGVQVPLGHGRATVDLRDIKQFYEQWTLGDTPLTFGSQVPTHVASTLTYDDSDQYFSDQKYLLYVHGWNMTPFDKEAFASTAYKRLWWNGYRGRYGALRWPTDNGFDSWFDIVFRAQHYDKSELIAWQTGERLASWLPGQSSRNHCPIDLLGHSMGNIVVGNALRMIPSGQESVAGVYVASQAAVPARLFDPTMSRCKPWNPTLLGYSDWNTPDVYQTGLLQTVAQRFSVANFHNRNDYALSDRISGLNQLLKPDANQGDYLTGPTDVDEVTEAEFRDRFHKVTTSGPPKGLTYSYVVYRWSGSDPTPQADYPTYYHLTSIEQPPMGQYRIMAYLSESRHFPLGASFSLLFQPGSANGDMDLNGSTIWPIPAGKHLESEENAFGPYSTHRWHSGQFRMTMPEQKEYWKSLMGACGYATDGVLP